MSAGIRTPCSNTKQGTQTRERTARAHSQPHAHMKTGHDGSVRALSQNPWMTPDQSDRTLTLPPLPLLRRNTKNMTAQEHDYIRLTHNRQDKKNLNTETKKGREEGETSQCQQDSPEGHSREGREGWAREAQTVQESQQLAKVGPEG